MHTRDNLTVITHPLVQAKLGTMPCKDCSQADFKRLLKEISMLMAFDITKYLCVSMRRVETPLTETDVAYLPSPPVIVPVLRAGLGMADGLSEILSDSPIGHIGLYRDEETKKPVEYMVRLPQDRGNLFIVTYPMLATGNSAVHACDILVRYGVEAARIILVSLIAAPEGVACFQKSHPDIKIVTAALDERLDERAYIVPGLGDAGDRIYGT